ncbi:hypothetical protein FRB93_011497 [Tulasnella sp. JGI-2019a]|nr:hypothetical protein FRB93_011497 [Tulasnella sp. JGI-2019a]
MEDITAVPDHSLRSLARAEWLSFSVGPPENVLLFAQAVHRFAIAHSRQRDDIWMADYAYGCLSDEALDWFEDLDDDVKRDWSSLRSAMITKFRRNEIVPTATAATFGLRLEAMSRCRVKVIKKDGALLGYVGPPAREEIINVVTSEEEALVLDIPKGWGTQEEGAHIRMVVASEAYPSIGLHINSDKDWDLRACEAESNVVEGRAHADVGPIAHLASSKVWTIKTLNNSTEELRALWMNDTGRTLSPFLDFAGKAR